MTIYQIGLLQVGFLCFIGLCIYALGKAVAPKRKPEPDWKAECEEARQIVRDIYWMALRYADGRQTYAPGMVNDAVQKGYKKGWLNPNPPNTPQFAMDGSDKETSREF